jgi:hypothetical protein
VIASLLEDGAPRIGQDWWVHDDHAYDTDVPRDVKWYVVGTRTLVSFKAGLARGVVEEYDAISVATEFIVGSWFGSRCDGGDRVHGWKPFCSRYDDTKIYIRCAAMPVCILFNSMHAPPPYLSGGCQLEVTSDISTFALH